MVEAVYMNNDKTKTYKMSRKSVREVLVGLPEIKGYLGAD
jgi:hypothetical protein